MPEHIVHNKLDVTDVCYNVYDEYEKAVSFQYLRTSWKTCLCWSLDYFFSNYQTWIIPAFLT